MASDLTAASTCFITNVTNSSMISNIEYLIHNRRLTILFKNGEEYIYEGVDYRTYEAFVKADSHGQFFNENIKGKYASFKLEEV